jgi:hypothetical protein
MEENMKENSIRPWLNMIFLIATIVVNGLANALPLNGLNTGEISDRFDVYFVPAGYVFSIWGVIYLGLILFAVYQLLPSQRANPRLGRIGYLFVLSCVANMAWLFLWHYEFFAWSLVAMVILLLSLIAIYLRLGVGREEAPLGEKWLIRVPFSVYLGWITVATIANATSLLDYLGWNGWGINEETWFLIIILVATGIASAVSLTRGDVAYLLVILWAFIGIAVKQAGVPLVETSTWIAIIIVGIMFLVGVVFRRRIGFGPWADPV